MSDEDQAAQGWVNPNGQVPPPPPAYVPLAQPQYGPVPPPPAPPQYGQPQYGQVQPPPPQYGPVPPQYGPGPVAPPPPYGYANPYGMPIPVPFEPLAIAGLAVVGGSILLSFVLTFFGVGTVVGAILGLVALSRIKRTGHRGRGLALGAVIGGFGAAALMLLFLVLFLVLFLGVLGAGASSGYST